MTNFSWDWIYRHLGARQPKLREAAARCADSYARAGLLLRLPFAGDMSTFPRIEDVPLVARQPRVPRAESRRRLGLGGETVLLVSFGGFGLPGFDPRVLAPHRGLLFLTSDRLASPPPNVRVVGAAELAALELGYPEMVGAADVVVTKPGYGIVADAIGAGVRMIYTDRGDFPEYPVIVAGMKAWLACAHVPRVELMAGRWSEAIREVLAQDTPPPPDMSGARVAASRILATVAHKA
jgi:L-arabinokinase